MDNEDLADFISSVSGEDLLAVEESFGDGYVRLRTAEAERRQAKHDIRSVEDIVIELLRNARDADASHIFVATGRSESSRTITVLDDGEGIPPEMHERIFEPRVTSKLDSMVVDHWGVHGRGMALYSIRCNALSALVKSSDKGLGSSFEVDVDLNALPEKTDQSNMPELEKDEEGELVVGRGPHNIARTVVEFALESKDRLSVYLGSPTDIAATLVERGRRNLDDKELLFCDDVEKLPVCLRPAAAADAAELVEICASLGIPISERTAHRILAGQIPSSEPPLKQLNRAYLKSATRPKRGESMYKDKRGLKIAPEDLSRFSSALEEAFSTISGRYFLELSGTPKVTVGKDCITVKFPIDKEA